MLLINRNLYIFLVLLMSGTVAMQKDLLDTLATSVAPLFAGLELTSLYLLSLGTAYPPIDKDVTFWCVKPYSEELVQTYLNDPDIRSKIDFRYPINLLWHGWLSGIDGGNRYLPEEVRSTDGWMRSTTIDWSRADGSNICSVDWSRLANYEYSVAALVNTIMVTNYTIKFMDFLIANGMKVNESVAAGHSLGAQIAGAIGRHYGGIMDAIFGIDPAGPGFTVPWDFGVGTRLSKSDARYVQCIHTSMGTLGTAKECGHADFILNGGYTQPGCISLFCSHSRSHEYFNEAMLPKNIFSGVKCRGSITNFITNLLGVQCSSETDRLGIHSERKTGQFFLKTNSKSPFAQTVEQTVAVKEKEENT